MELINNSISHDQRRKIFGMIKELKITKDQLYQFMPEWCGATSLSADNCNSHQADKIIENLNAVKNKTKILNNNSFKLTADQLKAINTLQWLLNWNDKQVSGFIKHTVKRYCAPADLSSGEASKVITGLNVYKKQLKKKSA